LSSPPLRSVDYFGEILNRDAKRILVSHLRTWEERKEAAPKAAKKAAKAEEPALDLPKVEKTTLGDLSALAELKASLEAEAKPAKAAKAEEPAEEKPVKKAAAKKTKKEE
jgi:small subunit ribosomal protein S1